MSEPKFKIEQTVNPIATVVSEGQPQKGQKHRSSGNFSTQTQNPPQMVQWWVTDNTHSSEIKFDVMEDIKLGHDPVIYAGLTNGAITKYYSSRSLYIANPQNTGGQQFGVQVWPYPS